MAISNGNKITATDLNALINSVQTTYRKYGFSGTAATTAADNITKLSAINTAINKLNSSINNSANRRFYYYNGSTVGAVSAGALLSSAKISEINTTNIAVANDYCNCDSYCSCDSYCNCDSHCRCDNDCACDLDCCKIDIFTCNSEEDCPGNLTSKDCCDTNCSCDTDCSCDSDCCDVDCCDSDY